MTVTEARKEYLKNYQRNWVAKRRADFFVDKFCLWCGSTEKLELDHIDPSTKIANAIWSWSEPRRLAEISKCQILCHNCHLKKTILNGDTSKFGEDHANCRFSNAEVLEMKRLRSEGLTYAQIGNVFHTSKQSVWDIVVGRTRTIK